MLPQKARIKPYHIVIIAGEESGDRHAASLIGDLIQHYPDICISGIGGKHMVQAGADVIYDLASYGVTGISEVLKHLLIIRQAFKKIKTHLIKNPPDLLVLVDYPGFNLRLAKFAKEQLNLKIVYYISPQIWAWKSGRIHHIKKYVDHMAVIYPFEKKIYQQATVPVSFVGNPLVLDNQNKMLADLPNLRQHLNLPLDKKIIALLPGSRNNEIEAHLSTMISAIEQLSERYSDLHIVIPIAKTIALDKVKAYFAHVKIGYSLIKEQAIEVVRCSDCVVVASGTASLECALLLKPMCVVYKGALISYIAAMKLVKIKYLSLCNILQEKMIVPELLQYDFNPHELAIIVEKLLFDHLFSQNIQRNLAALKTSLNLESADCTLTELIIDQLKK